MTPSWGCYWFGQWLANLMFAVEQGMELIAVHKQDGQGAGTLDRFPAKQDWEGTDGKQFSKDGFLGGSQVCTCFVDPSSVVFVRARAYSDRCALMQ